MQIKYANKQRSHNFKEHNNWRDWQKSKILFVCGLISRRKA